MVVNDPALPQNTAAVARLLSALHPSQVGLRAHQRNKVRFLDLTIRPHRPPLWRCCIVLIDYSIDAIFPQSVRKRSNPVLMLTRIMAVANEKPGRGMLCHLRNCSRGAIRRGLLFSALKVESKTERLCVAVRAWQFILTEETARS